MTSGDIIHFVFGTGGRWVGKSWVARHNFVVSERARGDWASAVAAAAAADDDTERVAS